MHMPVLVPNVMPAALPSMVAPPAGVTVAVPAPASCTQVYQPLRNVVRVGAGSVTAMGAALLKEISAQRSESCTV